MALNPKRTAAIVKAASRVFYDQGFSGASMDLVAQAAGVSKATVYNHFASKSSLFRAAVAEVSATFLSGLGSTDLDDKPLNEALLILSEHFLDFLLQPDNLSAVRVILAETIHEPSLGIDFHEAGPAVAQQAVAAFLRRRGERGELPDIDFDRAARHLVALLRGDLFWRALLYVEVDTAERKRHVESSVDHFLRGVGASPLATALVTLGS